MKKTTLIISALVLLLSVSCRPDNPLDSYFHDGTPSGETVVKPGKGGLFADGYGTEDSPYIIETARHMQNIQRGLIDGEMVYFKMANDIDMSGISWVALNPYSPYSKFIDFDGGGHVITNLYCPKQSYGGFFGVLCGSCHDVGFLNAYVESSNSGGVLGGYVGIASPKDGNYTGRVERVYATGVVRAGGNGGAFCGDLGKIADMSPCIISDCYAMVEVNAGSHGGGLAGSMRSGSRIENSYSAGSVYGGSEDNNACGGLAGNIDGGTITGSIAWNSKIAKSPSCGSIYGNLASGSVTDSYCVSSQSGGNITNPGVLVKTKEELQAIASAWGGGWYTDGKISNGYPILIWQYERGDFEEYSGHGVGDNYKPSFKSGSGTEADPYIIDKLVHLRSMHNLIEANSETWFRLEANIDCASLTNWVPINNEAPYDKKIHFDGNNYTISNLRSTDETYSSFFGVLYGECKNLTFDRCIVTQNVGSTCGILGGFAGTSDKDATITNVTLTESCYVSSTNNQPCGGFFGKIGNANVTITDCVSNATVEGLNNKSEKSTDHGVGGFVGKVEGTVIFERCVFGGEAHGVWMAGGIVGSTGGHAVTITSCGNTGTVTSVKVNNAVAGKMAGGIAGIIDNGSTVTSCYNTGSVEGVSMAGGIVGSMEQNNSSVVSKCYSTGTIRVVGGNFCGGIVGYATAGDILDCWSVGSVYVSQQIAGGIVGELKSGYLNDTYPNTTGRIINCWTKAAISGQRVLGGIAGRCAHDGWNATSTNANTMADITLSGCIAWNPSITCSDKRDKDVEGSSGAIIGYTFVKNTLTNNWRNPAMSFTAPYADCEPIDQPDASPDSPLTVGVATKYCYPYHGKAAAGTATVSSVATSIGWNESVWDLSGNEPKLK